MRTTYIKLGSSCNQNIVNSIFHPWFLLTIWKIGPTYTVLYANYIIIILSNYVINKRNTKFLKKNDSLND